jgi:spermidine synthase
MQIRVFLSVLFVSVAILAAEMGIIRYMSVAGSASFAAMMISIALLGFGISGTIITIFRERFERRIDLYLYLSALLFLLSSGYAIPAAQTIEFIPQSLQQDAGQILKLGQYYLVFFVPFFFGALFINASFLKMKKGIGALYFFNLLGSGIGALAILVIMSLIPPQYLLAPVAVLLAVPCFLLAPKKIYHAVTLGVVAVSLIPVFSGLKLEISPYKDISYAQKFPDAKIIREIPSPTGFIQVMESSQFHFAPGLSLSSYDVSTPNQLGLYIDGFSASGIARNVEGKDAAYINDLPFSFPFALKKSPKVLILGSGGGNPVLFAKKLGASAITAVEPNAPLVAMLKKDFSAYTGSVYENVSHVVSDGRSFCQRDTNTYDILTLPAMLSSGMSFSSGSGNGENYLFTREAIEDYFARLSPGGIAAISMTLVSPPRSLLKLEATAFDYMKKAYPSDFKDRIVFLRGLDWGMILLKKGTFSADDISALKQKASVLTADFSYYPGITEKEINKNNIIEDELYYKLARSYLDGANRQFIDQYFFNINPPTDSKPFFDHNLRFSSLFLLFGETGSMENIPFSEWGYFVNWATLVQGVFFALIVIAIPAVVLGRKFVKQKGKLSVITYFSALGLGFMLVEINIIQKLTLVIANPLYSVALVIASLLIFSGIGSRFSGRIAKDPNRAITLAAAGVAVTLILHVVVFSLFSRSFLSCGEVVRIVIAVVSLAPMGFFMGMPFPLGLQALSDKNESFMPWALAVNGSVSVFAAVFTSILSMHLGFTAVMFVALACYGIAWLSFPAKRL